MWRSTSRQNCTKFSDVSKFPPDYTASHTSKDTLLLLLLLFTIVTTSISLFPCSVKNYGEGGGIAPSILNLSIRKEKDLLHVPAQSFPRGKTPGTQQTKGCASPGTSLGSVHTRTGNKGSEEGQRYSSTLSLTSALDRGGWSTPRSYCFAPWKESRYPFYTKLGGPQGRSGRVRKGSSYNYIRSPDRPASTESLYRLSYPGPCSRLCVEDKSTHARNETPVLQSSPNGQYTPWAILRSSKGIILTRKRLRSPEPKTGSLSLLFPC